jgi:putative photosynthetic complex assembly protein
MSDSHNNLMPRKALIAFAALIGFSLVLVIAARVTGMGISHAPAQPVVKSLDVRFEPRDDGALLVLAVDDGAIVKVLAPGSNQFLRGVLRAVARERRRHGLGGAGALQVARLADGRLTVRDPETSKVIELKSFGPTNEGAFAAILDARGPAPAHLPPVTAAETGQPR